MKEVKKLSVKGILIHLRIFGMSDTYFRSELFFILKK